MVLRGEVDGERAWIGMDGRSIVAIDRCRPGGWPQRSRALIPSPEVQRRPGRDGQNCGSSKDDSSP
jgi:hypothetical protein